MWTLRFTCFAVPARSNMLQHVLGLRAPAKICQPVVQRTALTVQALHVLRARPDKRLKDKAMDPALFQMSVHPKSGIHVPAIRPKFQYSTSLRLVRHERLHVPLIRDFVLTLVTHYRQP